MITVFRGAATSKKVEWDTADVQIEVHQDTVVLTFLTAGGKGLSRIQLVISSDSRAAMISHLVASLANGRPKNLTDYSTDELLEVVKTRMEG